MFLILLASLLAHIVAVPVRDKCPSIMSEAGLSPMFAPMITHSVHALTLEDIRYYFKSDATEENGIPTVNMDLASEDRVLPNAPLVGYDEDFSTMGLKSFDMVMRNMNRTWWGITDYSVLEKVAHVLHMSEVWSKAEQKYKEIEKLLDPESDVCGCVTDLENNGVMNYLHLLAFKIRYPGITSGNENITNYYLDPISNITEYLEDTQGREKRSPQEDWRVGGNWKSGNWDVGGSISGNPYQTSVGAEVGYNRGDWRGSASYDYSRDRYGGSYSSYGGRLDYENDRGTTFSVFGNRNSGGGWNAGIGFGIKWRSLKFDDIDFSLSDIQLLKDVAEKLVDEDFATLHHIDNAEHWEYWKKVLKRSSDDASHYDLAMFMFCMLN